MSGIPGKPMRIEPLAAASRATWDGHVRQARNGHFFFERGFLDHHGDRFEDASLLFLRGGRLFLVLPAHVDGEALVSHGGLPFAGFIVSHRCGRADTSDAFDLLEAWMRGRGLRRLVYRPVPWPYHAMVFEDDLYELHRRGARIAAMKLSAGFPGPVSPCARTSTRRRLSRQREKCGLAMRETDDVAAFWPRLVDFLDRKGYRPPVHTQEQMRLLRDRFPRHIRLVVAEADGQPVAGKILFLSPRVMKLQYGYQAAARGEAGLPDREVLLHWAATHPDLGRPWIDLGTSMDPETGALQSALMAHKEQLGARGVAAATWEWTLE